MLEEAIRFATRAHEGQMRRDGVTQYISHPLRVMRRLQEAGVQDEAVLMAAVLHDTVEDTATTLQDLQPFGTGVVKTVAGLTLPEKVKGRRPPGAKRGHFAAFRKGPWEATLVKLADRLDNLLDWQGMEEAYKRTYALEGLRIYVACMENRQRPPPAEAAAKERLAAQLLAVCQETLHGTK